MLTVEAGLQMLQAQKQAFIDLLPQILTILGNPQDMIFDTLVTLNESFIKLNTPVSILNLFFPLACLIPWFCVFLDDLVNRCPL